MSIHNIQEADALLLYKVGPVFVCSPTMQVEAVVMPPKFNATPGANEAEPGMFRSIHGLVRVVDLRVRFGVDKEDTSSPGRILITEVEGGHAGFWVDEIEDIVSFPKTGWKPVPTHIPREVFSKTLLMEGHIRLYAEFEQLDKFKTSGYLRKHIEQIKQQEVRKETTQEKNIQQPAKSFGAGIEATREPAANERSQVKAGLTNKAESNAGDFEIKPDDDRSRLYEDVPETNSSNVKSENAKEYQATNTSGATKASSVSEEQFTLKKSHELDAEHNIKPAHSYSRQQQAPVPEVNVKEQINSVTVSDTSNRSFVRNASKSAGISTEKVSDTSRHSASTSIKSSGSGVHSGAVRKAYSTDQPVKQVTKQGKDIQDFKSDDNGASVGLVFTVVSLLIVAVLLYAFLIPEDYEDGRRVIVRESSVKNTVKNKPVIEHDYSEPVSRSRVSNEPMEPEGKVTISQVENDMVIVVNDYEKEVVEVVKVEADPEAEKTEFPVASVEEATAPDVSVIESTDVVDGMADSQLVDESVNDEQPVLPEEFTQRQEDVGAEKTLTVEDNKESPAVVSDTSAGIKTSGEEAGSETLVVEVDGKSELVSGVNGNAVSSEEDAASEAPPVVVTKPSQVMSKKTSRHVHIVVKGDTLWHIANRYVNNPWRYPELARLSKIKNPDLIYPGQKIIIILNHK